MIDLSMIIVYIYMQYKEFCEMKANEAATRVATWLVMTLAVIEIVNK